MTNLYAEFHGESIPIKEEILRICHNIENCEDCKDCESCGNCDLKPENLIICYNIENCEGCENCETCENCDLKQENLIICYGIDCEDCQDCETCENCNLKQELNFEDESQDLDHDGCDNHDDEEHPNSEGSDHRKDESENDTSILAYKFAMMISSGEVEKLAEEEFLSKRSAFPTYIDIDKTAISDALGTLKVSFLDEEYRSSQLIGKRKYTISCTLCPYKKNQRSLIMKHLRVHFKKMFWCVPCSKSVTEITNHIRTQHSDNKEEWSTAVVPDLDLADADDSFLVPQRHSESLCLCCVFMA